MGLSMIELKQAKRIDFTGSVAGFEHPRSYDDQVLSSIRNSRGVKTLIVIDRGFALRKLVPYVVQDHLNLSGSNPLVGPNDPAGERFPSVNDIYITDLLSALPRGIAAGLRPGVVPSADQLNLIRSLGADFYCYNLVPTMIVAAHAQWRVLGIVVLEGVALDAQLLDVLQNGGGN